MRAAVYLRVSSDKQAAAGSIESQRRDVPAYAARMGWQIVDTYEDDGKSAGSGHLDARDGFARLLADAGAGRFDVVVGAEVDRFTRADDLAEVGQILGAFQRGRVKLATTSGQILDLGTFHGRIMAAISTAAAAQWLEMHKARVKAGKLTAISRGRKPAGPTPYGYRYDRAAHAWHLDETTAPIVAEVYRRIAAGESCADVAADFAARGVPARRRPWTRASVWTLLRGTTYTGRWCADKARRLTVAVPPIVTPEEWAAAQATLAAQGKRGLRRTRHVYLLEGLARCGLCDAPIRIQSATGVRNGHTRAPAQYVCARRKEPIGPPCTGPRISTAAMDDRLWDVLTDAVLSPTIGECVARARRDGAPSTDPDAAIRRATVELARLDRAEATLIERVDRITPAVLDAQLARLATARQAARDAIAAAEAQRRAERVTVAAVATMDAALAKLREVMPIATPAERRELAAILLGDVEIGAEALSAEIHLPIGVSLVGAAGYSRSAPERRPAGRVRVALPLRVAA